MANFSTPIAAMDNLSGHAWVIDGHVNQSRTKQMFANGTPSGSPTTESRYLIHCNFGWENGWCNGYYFSGVFDLSDGPVDTEEEVDLDKPGSEDSDFNWWFRVIDYKN